MSTESSDEELLASGGAEGFGLLYERRYRLIRGYLRGRIGSRPELMLDLVAETFACALERREKFDPQRGSAVGWLLGIAHHLLVDTVRRGHVADESRRRLGMERILIEDAQIELIESESQSDLQQALAELPVEQRRAVEERVLQEESYTAMATRIGSSEQVVRKRVSRGLTALRESIKENA